MTASMKLYTMLKNDESTYNQTKEKKRRSDMKRFAARFLSTQAERTDKYQIQDHNYILCISELTKCIFPTTGQYIQNEIQSSNWLWLRILLFCEYSWRTPTCNLVYVWNQQWKITWPSPSNRLPSWCLFLLRNLQSIPERLKNWKILKWLKSVWKSLFIFCATKFQL